MTSESDSSKDFNIAAWFVIAFLIVTTTSMWLVYRIRFPGGLTTNHQRFAEFGDFFGGVLNPVLTALTVILLIFSLRLQLKELKNSTTELRNSNHELKNNRTTLEETRLVHADNVRVQQLNILIPIAVKRMDDHIFATWEAMKVQLTFHYMEESEALSFSDLQSLSVSTLEICLTYKHSKIDRRVQKLSTLIAKEGETDVQQVLISQIEKLFGFIDEIHIIVSELQGLESHSLVYFEYLRQLTSIFFRLRDIVDLLDDKTQQGVNARFEKNNAMTSIVLDKYMPKPSVQENEE